MSSLWTPSGEYPLGDRRGAASAPDPDGEPTADEPTADEPTADERAIEAEIDEARARLAEVPAEVIVLNHAMGLYELAAIHLSAAPPHLTEAALAIDAFGCLIEGLGDRLGPDAATLREALGQIRLAFVQIKGSVGAEDPPPPS